MNFNHALNSKFNLLKSGKIDINSWLNQLPVSSKIAIGYIVSLGITLAGATTGLLISNQYEEYVQEITEDIVEEVQLVSELKVDFVHVMMHQQALAASLNNLEQFQHEYQELKLYESRLDQAWAVLKNSYEEAEVAERSDEVELINRLHQEYERSVIPYLESFHQTIQQLNIDHSTTNLPQDLLEDLEVIIHDFYHQSEEISQILSQLSEALATEAEEAQETLKTAQFIHNIIISTSILLSALIALLLSRYTTKAISIPIQKLTHSTQKVTRDSDFSLQVPVTSQDEIGSLTQSFNHLIAKVNYLLEEQRKSAQAQLMQHEKLSSLGQMVAGIAHEINNPVSCISGNINYLIEYSVF